MSTHKKAARSASRSKRSSRRARPLQKRAPSRAKAKAKAKPKAGNAVKNFEAKALALIQKGRDRGFVTYDEILKEFPQIENDITFLDGLYAKLSAANVDVLEGGGLLELEDPKDKKPAHL